MAIGTSAGKTYETQFEEVIDQPTNRSERQKKNIEMDRLIHDSNDPSYQPEDTETIGIPGMRIPDPQRGYPVDRDVRISAK